MALDNITFVNYTDKETIKNWFKTGLKPKQDQFWAQFDSYWHKSESLPISSISGLGNLLDGKAESNHTHDIYATNDATSLTPQNVTAWQNKLGINDLDYVVIPTEDATENSHPYVVVIDNEGNSARRNANDFSQNSDSVPLTGTEEGKPLTGSIELGSELSEPLFKRGESSPTRIYSESLTLNNGFRYRNSDQILERMVMSGISAGIHSGEYIQSSFGHMVNSDNGIYGSFDIINGLAIMTFSEGVTSQFNMDDLRPDDYSMFAQRSYVRKLLRNYGGATNWTSPSQQFSGLLDKSQDATYDKKVVIDSRGFIAVSNDIRIPTPPETGNYRLESINGVISWVEIN